MQNLRPSGRLQLVPLTLLLFAAPMLRAQEPLFLPVNNVGDRERAWEQNQRQTDRSITDVQYVRVNVPALDAMRLRRTSRRSLSVNLFGSPYQIEFTKMEPSVLYFAYEGQVRGHGGSVALAVGNRGFTGGYIEFHAEIYQLVYTGIGDTHALFNISRERQSQFHGNCATKSQPAGTGMTLDATPPAAVQGPAMAAATTTIDVMTFYTPAARNGAGGTNAIQSVINGAMAQANAGSSGSGVQHTLRLVHTALTNYNETGSLSTTLSRFRGTNDGFMDEVHAKRNTYGGDLMTLIANSGGGICGIASIMTTVSTSFAPRAFSVTARGCISNRSFTHEMGHTMGSAHDRANAGSAAYSYSYGARTSNNASRSIMAYSPGVRVNRWSGPNITWGGLTLGSATEDNTRSLTNTAPTVARFRTAQMFQFSTLPGGIVGTNGKPTISGQGTANGTVPIQVIHGNALNNTPGVFIADVSLLNAPIFGGTLVPNTTISVPVTGTSGTTAISLPVLASLGSGVPAYFQVWFLDNTSPQGFSATDGLMTILP